MSSVLEERITQGPRLVRATYDPEADAVALHFQSEPEPSGLGESAIAYSEYWEPPDFPGLISPLYLHFDGDDRLIAMDIHYASKLLPKEFLAQAEMIG